MKKILAYHLLFVTSGVFGMCVTAYAEAQLVDHSQSVRQISDSLEVDQGDVVVKKSATQNESADQRVARLERQIANLADMNLMSKLEKMQQEVQQLRGQIEVQNHDLAQLKEQQRHFYVDLDQRLNKVTNTASASDAEPSFNTTSKDSAKDAPNKTIPIDKSEKELQAYEDAFNLLNKKQYEKAVGAFQTFIKTYPESMYAVNAHYWLGEIFYLKAKPTEANNEFELIVAKYPTNQKVPDALLKMAIIAMDNGNYNAAKTHLQKIQKQFPGTSSAKVATLRLKELKAKSKS